MKQTAIEWLTEKLRAEFGFAFSDNILEQAKEMEKKDICYFGAKCCIKTTEKKSWTIEELYNETFKQ
jgi:hypothetical protein